jgi:hypothetical protein
MTPAAILSPICSPEGDPGRSMDMIEDPRACRDERDPIELVLSSSAPRYFDSSLPFFLSFFPLLEKKDLPPDDCRDLSEPDMTPASFYKLAIAEGRSRNRAGLCSVFRYHGYSKLNVSRIVSLKVEPAPCGIRARFRGIQMEKNNYLPMSSVLYTM